MVAESRTHGRGGAPSSAVALMARGGTGVLALRIVALLVLLGMELVLTRTLGRDRYDLLAVGLSWLAILGTLSSLGLPTALVRFLPADRARGRFARMQGATGWAARAMVGTATGVGLLFALVVLLGGEAVAPDQRRVLWIVAAAVPVLALNLHRQAVLQGLKHPVLALLPEQLVRPVAVAVLVLGLRALHAPVEAWEAAGAVGIALLLAFACGQHWRRRCTPPEVRRARGEVDRRLLLATALPLGWMSVMQLLATRADPAMLGALGEAGDAALYSVADRLATLLLFGLIAVNAVAAPLISELHTTGRRGELARVLRLAAVGIAVFTLPLAAVLLTAGPFLLSFFGAGFTAGYGPLVLLVVGQAANALTGSVGYLLIMTGHQGVAVRILTGCALLKVVANLLLIPTFGATGAAAASAGMLILQNGAMYVAVRRRLGLDPTLLSLLRRPGADPAEPR